MEKKIIIGIDVSKDKLDICMLKAGCVEPLEETVVENSPGLLREYLGSLCGLYGSENLTACMEHTGHYGLVACTALQEAGIIYAVVPALEIKRRQGMARGKSDRIDARRIAEYAWRYADRLRPYTLPEDALMEARSLVTLRDMYMRQSVMLRNALHAHEPTPATESLRRVLETVQGEVEGLEERIGLLMRTNPDTGRNYDLLQSVKGIGPLIAAALVLATGNFTLFCDARKFNSYAGLAPFPNESGKTRRPARTSRMANRKIKTLLHNGAASAANYDPELRAYYKRKTGEGKKDRCVKNAIACKLVYRAFAVIKRQTPFVNLYQHKIV